MKILTMIFLLPRERSQQSRGRLSQETSLKMNLCPRRRPRLRSKGGIVMKTRKEKELEAEKQVWKWWEEENALPDGVKWKFL